MTPLRRSFDASNRVSDASARASVYSVSSQAYARFNWSFSTEPVPGLRSLSNSPGNLKRTTCEGYLRAAMTQPGFSFLNAAAYHYTDDSKTCC